MFLVKAHRSIAVFEQIFQTFDEANNKAKELVGLGFAAEVTRAHARS